MKSNLRNGLLIGGLFILFGLLFGIQAVLFLASIGVPISPMQTIGTSLLNWSFWACLFPAVFFLTQRYPVRAERWPRDVGMNLILAVVFILLKALWDTVLFRWFPFGPFQPETFGQGLKIIILSHQTMVNCMTYSMLVSVLFAFRYYQKFQEREKTAYRLESQLAQTQLQMLKMQIHPHFLFNTLNAISSLIYDNPKAADNMITHLSDMLRYTLKNIGVQEIPLREEIELVKQYLEIERFRFMDRLKVEYEVDAETLNIRVPTMILQPLVENSIRHGISKRSQPGRIVIRALRDNGHLRLQIQDNGPGLAYETGSVSDGGMGLANTRQRLRQMYGSEQSLKFAQTDAGETVVSIDIPLRKESP